MSKSEPREAIPRHPAKSLTKDALALMEVRDGLLFLQHSLCSFTSRHSPALVYRTLRSIDPSNGCRQDPSAAARRGRVSRPTNTSSRPPRRIPTRRANLMKRAPPVTRTAPMLIHKWKSKSRSTMRPNRARVQRPPLPPKPLAMTRRWSQTGVHNGTAELRLSHSASRDWHLSPSRRRSSSRMRRPSRRVRHRAQGRAVSRRTRRTVPSMAENPPIADAGA